MTSVTLRGREKVTVIFEEERASEYRASDGVGGKMWLLGAE